MLVSTYCLLDACRFETGAGTLFIGKPDISSAPVKTPPPRLRKTLSSAVLFELIAEFIYDKGTASDPIKAVPSELIQLPCIRSELDGIFTLLDTPDDRTISVALSSSTTFVIL